MFLIVFNFIPTWSQKMTKWSKVDPIEKMKDNFIILRRKHISIDKQKKPEAHFNMDPRLIPRLRDFIQSNLAKNLPVDFENLAESLIRKYPEYQRKKRKTFLASVEQGMETGLNMEKNSMKTQTLKSASFEIFFLKYALGFSFMNMDSYYLSKRIQTLIGILTTRGGGGGEKWLMLPSPLVML